MFSFVCYYEYNELVGSLLKIKSHVLNFPRICLEFLLDFPWISLGFFLDFPWISLGFLLEFHLDFSWNFLGFLLDFPWIFLGILMDFPWIYISKYLQSRVHPYSSKDPFLFFGSHSFSWFKFSKIQIFQDSNFSSFKFSQLYNSVGSYSKHFCAVKPFIPLLW